MTINFKDYGRFYAFACDEDKNYSYKREDGYTLHECASWCEKILDALPHLNAAYICDNLTGEVVATFIPEDEEEENWDDDFRDDWDDEVGFNPYEGCYDYDC